LVEWNSTGKQALSHLTLGLFEEILRFCNGRQRTDADPILLGAKYMMILEFGSEGRMFCAYSNYKGESSVETILLGWMS